MSKIETLFHPVSNYISDYKNDKNNNDNTNNNNDNNNHNNNNISCFDDVFKINQKLVPKSIISWSHVIYLKPQETTFT